MLKFTLPILLFFVSCASQESQSADLEKEILKILEPEEEVEIIEIFEEEFSPESYVSPYLDTLKRYRFTGIDLCGQTNPGPNGPSRLLSFDTLDKYGARKVYNWSRTLEEDSIYIRFDYIGDCCLYAMQGLELKSDRILLHPVLAGDAPCDCYCDYAFHYALHRETYEKFEIEHP